MTGRAVSRRAFLGTAIGGTLVAAGGVAFATRSDSDAASATRVAFRGPSQAGVTTPGQRHAIIAAFDTTASDRHELGEMLRALSAESESLMAGEVPAQSSPLLPPADNLIVGTDPEPDDLTITTAVGASLFDERFGLAGVRPKQLRTMDRFPNDRIRPERSHGDVLIQVCAQTPDSCNHALRRLMRATRSTLTLRWLMPGFQQPNTLGKGETSTRNLLGFKDGTANLDGSDSQAMAQQVWVAEGDDPAPWTVGGSYMVVRMIRNRVEFWDRTPLRTQELIIGRSKPSGAPLSGTRETDVPNYANDPKGEGVPLRAHIRLANPRTAPTERNRILRRGFSYSLGFSAAGQLDQGLLFVCFQRDLDEGFVAIQKRLDGEPLEEYIQPFGGGYFFVLPGASTPDGWLGRSMIDSG